MDCRRQYADPLTDGTSFLLSSSHISHLTNLLVQEVQRQLEADSLHVRPLEGRGDVHVHVQEPDRQETKHYNYISCC